jgi:Leucine-rich repeat (LRR) protein
MTTEIETYLNSLSKDILTLNISGKCKGIKSLLDLTRFKNLKTLSCSDNQLTLLPTLSKNLENLFCSNNIIYEIVNNDSLITIKQNIQTLNNFRYLYYCLQFKKHFRKWLWEKVRKHTVKKIYSPMYLIENLGEDDNLDTVLNNWINK